MQITCSTLQPNISGNIKLSHREAYLPHDKGSGAAPFNRLEANQCRLPGGGINRAVASQYASRFFSSEPPASRTKFPRMSVNNRQSYSCVHDFGMSRNKLCTLKGFVATLETPMPRIEGKKGEFGQARWRLVYAPQIPSLLSVDPLKSLTSNISFGTEVEVQLWEILQMTDSEMAMQWTLIHQLTSRLRVLLQSAPLKRLCNISGLNQTIGHLPDEFFLAILQGIQGNKTKERSSRNVHSKCKVRCRHLACYYSLLRDE